MHLPVRTPQGVRLISFEMSPAFPREPAKDWHAFLAGRSSTQQHDTVEFLESAIKKFELYERRGRFAATLSALKTQVANNPNVDALGVITATAPWFEGGALAGFCQFRRTWCNHIVFDYLGIHPRLLAGSPREMVGLGTALLYRIGLIASDFGARVVWGEATDISSGYYAQLFGLEEVLDLVVVERDDFLDAVKSAIDRLSKSQ